MNERTSNPRGWSESLRGVGESLLWLVRNRLEVFAIEIHEEKLRFIRLAVWIALAAALGSAGVFVGVGVLALWLFRTTGYAGLVALALGSVMGAALVLLYLRHRIRHGPVPFATTIAEFKKDAECLRKN
jgi:uncharacterized membrane protein YqjE